MARDGYCDRCGRWGKIDDRDVGAGLLCDQCALELEKEAAETERADLHETIRLILTIDTILPKLNGLVAFFDGEDVSEACLRAVVKLRERRAQAVAKIGWVG